MQNPSAPVVALMCDINVVRADHKLPPLRWDWRLWWVAQRHATEMAETSTFGHLADLAARAAQAGYVFQGPDGLLNENVGWGRGPDSTPLALAIGWMRSARHRANLLDPDVRDVGIGIAEGATTSGGPAGTFYVAEFGNPGTPERAQASERPRSGRSACGSARRPGSAHAVRRWRATRARCRTARIRSFSRL